MFRPFCIRVVTFCFATVLLSSQVGAADLRYLPADTEIIFSINVKQILESDLARTQKEPLDQFKEAIKNIQAGNVPVQKLLEKFGFDPFKDFSDITVAIPPGNDLQEFFLLIEGKFNAGKVQAAAEEMARQNGDLLKISKAGAFQVYKISSPNQKPIHAVLLNANTLVLTQAEKGIQDAIGRAANAQKSTLKKEVVSLLDTTDTTQSLRFVITGNALLKLMANAPVPNAEAATQTIKDLDGLTFAVTLKKDIHFQLGIAPKDGEAAKKATASANFGLLTIRTLAEQKAKEDEKLKPLADLARTLKLNTDGKNIFLRGEISAENLQKLIKNLGQPAPGKEKEPGKVKEQGKVKEPEKEKGPGEAAAGEPLKSGPQAGMHIPGPFHPVNVTGPQAGKKHCLVSMNGKNPVVMIFVRESSDALTGLIKKIEAATLENKSKQLGSFVVYLSDDGKLADKLKTFALKEGIKNCVLAIDGVAGPKAYRIAMDAEVTIVLYNNRKVVANHAFRKGQFNDKSNAAVLADLPKLVSE